MTTGTVRTHTYTTTPRLYLPPAHNSQYRQRHLRVSAGKRVRLLVRRDGDDGVLLGHDVDRCAGRGRDRQVALDDVLIRDAQLLRQAAHLVEANAADDAD